MQQCVSSKFTFVVSQGWAGFNCFVVWTVALTRGQAPIKDHKINLTGGEMIYETRLKKKIQIYVHFWKIVYSVCFYEVYKRFTYLTDI